MRRPRSIRRTCGGRAHESLSGPCRYVRSNCDQGRHNESYREAARLLGPAGAMRDRTGEARFKVYDSAFESAVGVLRGALGDDEFDETWAEGAALSTEEAIAYAQR